jgi:hypothetical protein
VKKLKAGDYVVFVVVVGIILALFSRSFSFSGAEAYIQVTGPDFIGEFDLGQDRVVTVKGPLGMTRVIIEDGKARVEDSPCRDKICIRMGKVSRPGDEAVCLPNRVIVQMKGERGSVDAVSR